MALCLNIIPMTQHLQVYKIWAFIWCHFLYLLNQYISHSPYQRSRAPVQPNSWNLEHSTSQNFTCTYNVFEMNSFQHNHWAGRVGNTHPVSHVSHITCHASCVTPPVWHIMWHMCHTFWFTYPVSQYCITHHVSHITCDTACVTYPVTHDVSHIMCHTSVSHHMCQTSCVTSRLHVVGASLILSTGFLF